MKSVSLLTGRAVTGLFLLLALVVFELINYTTTVEAIRSILGNRQVNLVFLGAASLPVLMGLAMCLLDFAGIARIFTPQTGKDEPKAIAILFIVWVISAVFNAGLTWWSSAIWIASGYGNQNPLVDPGTVLTIAPRVLAVLFFLLHFGLIYTIAIIGDNLFSSGRGGYRAPSKGGGIFSGLGNLFNRRQKGFTPPSKPNKKNNRQPTPAPRPGPLPQPRAGVSRREEIESMLRKDPTVFKGQPVQLIGGDELEF